MLECPKCSFVPPNPKVQFCPNCGAKRVEEGTPPKREPRSATDASARHRRFVIVGCALGGLGVLYVGLYLVLTLGGHTERVMSGTYRDTMGTPVADLEQWQPRGVDVSRYREMGGALTTKADAAGWFFLPMVIADRRWWHHSKTLFSPPPKTNE